MENLRWGCLTPEVRLQDTGGGRVISGYAAVFYRKDDAGSQFAIGDRTVERIAPGAFDRALALLYRGGKNWEKVAP